MLGIEQHDAELLDAARAEPRHQVRRRVARPRNLERARSARAPASAAPVRAPPAICEARARADAGGAREVVERAARQPVQSAVRRQQRVGDAQRIAAPRAAADDQRDQLVVAERRRAVRAAASRAADRRATGLSSYTHSPRRRDRSHDVRATRARQPRRILGHVVARRLLLSLAIVAAIAGAACGDPPDKEMQQAQGAIDAARAAGADQYAHDEFTAAEDALKRAHDAVDQRDYRLALNDALDTRERAQTAAKEAVERQGHRPRRRRPRRWPTPTPRCHDARAKLKAAEAARVPARTLRQRPQGDRRRGNGRARSAHSVRQGRLPRRDRQGARRSARNCAPAMRTISRLRRCRPARRRASTAVIRRRRRN